jgi:hypothetical protein
VEVRDPAHRQPGQVSDGDTGGLGNRYRECTDRRGLVNDQQNAAVLVQRIKDFAQPDLVVGQGLVEELLPGPVHGNGVVLALADVQADKDINALVVSDHLYLPIAAADTTGTGYEKGNGGRPTAAGNTACDKDRRVH